MKTFAPGNLSNQQSTRRCRGLIAMLAFAAGIPSAEAIVSPYTPDASTLHLWHLNETSAPAIDSGSSALDLPVLGGAALLGDPSFPGFGNALNTAGSTSSYLAPAALINGVGDETSFPYSNPTTGAFTFEAIIRLDIDLTQTQVGTPRGVTPLHILTGEGEANGNRVWQFRIDPIGFSPNADGVTGPLTAPALEFINVNLGTAQNRVMFLPISGANAVELGAWYHVAVAYDGNEGIANNLSVYWTKLDQSHTEADLLIQRQLDTDLPVAPVDFAIGNIGRNPSLSNFAGLIDEVRISDTARAPTEFIFSVPEPSSMLAVLAGGTIVGLRRRVSRS
jgi:hypothetical protein